LKEYFNSRFACFSRPFARGAAGISAAVWSALFELGPVHRNKPFSGNPGRFPFHYGRHSWVSHSGFNRVSGNGFEMGQLRRLFLLLTSLLSFSLADAIAQGCGPMEQGFAFLTSSRGCAPYTVEMETLYLGSVPGTVYYVNWGDGTPEEQFIQTNSTGVIIRHTYPNSPVDCGYDVVIDAENACVPRGGVDPIITQVIVWTNDVISVAPGEFRVCQGFATSLNFVDNSDWNCFPHLVAIRENNAPRWIQWIYGTGNAANRIPGIQVNGVSPAFPYYDPAPGRNPMYPVTSPGQVSLSIDVPVTTPADIGKEFEVTLRNWNQCNPYDDNLLDGNAFNPVSGNIADGDNAPMVTTGRVVIVPAPEPDFLTRLGGPAGPAQTIFCIGDDIYFDNETPSISGANFQYTWEFYNNSTGAGTPLATRNQANPTFAYSTSGQKLVRLRVRDANAAGNCESVVERVITISPSLTARIRVTDLADNPISSDFCQEPGAPLATFDARFHDDSFGTPTPSTQYRWEFYDETNTMVFEAPAGGGFSATPLGPFDRAFTNKGVYRARLRIRDAVTMCESIDEVTIRVLEKPAPAFTFNQVCEGEATSFSESSTLNPFIGETIVSWEWDMSYDGVTFNSDPTLVNQRSFDYTFPTGGTHTVALRVTASPGGCSAILAQDVIVDPAPIATFTPSTTAGCSVLSLTLTNTGAASQPVAIDRYIWEIDEGGGFVVDSVQRPTDPGFTDQYTMYLNNHTLVDKIYQVRLRAVSVNNCETVSPPVAITVFPGPKSGFISVNYSPFDDNCSPREVDFTVDAETQSLNPSDYTWTVSDNNGVLDVISTGTTPTFSYEFINTTQSMRDFRVSLRTTLPTACYGDSTRLIRIAPLPGSDFEVDTLLFDCEAMNLRFEATQKGLSEYAWTLRVNGTIISASTGAADYFEYNFNRISSGDQNVEVTLLTRNLANCQSPATMRQVTVPQREDVVASFTASPTAQSWPNSTVTLTHNSGVGPWEYHWDFGDGTTSTNPTVGHHSYAAEGTYVITLTVSDGACMAQQVQSVTINAVPPIVDFTYDPSEGCVPLTVTFTNLSMYADPSTYLWEFGEDGATSRAVNPTFTYYKPGKKTVTLTASNASGEVVSVTKYDIIEVYPTVSAHFNIRPTVIQVPGGEVVTDNQSFGATSYLWDFGDGSTSIEYEPRHVYKQAGDGSFDISLIAYNDYGCSDTLKLEAAVQVIEGGRLLIPNAFSPDPSGPGSTDVQGNDLFLPIMEGVTEFQMLVFNRWGELLFETRDPSQGWDGYYKGQLCQQDVYVYKIQAKFSDGQTVTRIGDINLLR
jgi:gliding motility-associated-like protein